MLKQLGVLNAVTDLTSRRATKNTAPESSETTAALVTTTMSTGEEKEAAAENDNVVLEDRATSASPAVSVVSKEHAMQLLKPSQFGQAARKQSSSKYKVASATVTATTTQTPEDGDANAEAETETDLEGKFVNLVDLLLPVPSKGEFDVNKIKSSLYFFS